MSNEQVPSEKKFCTKAVEGPGHRYFTCDEPAAYLVVGTNWYRCAIHVKQHRDRGQKVQKL